MKTSNNKPLKKNLFIDFEYDVDKFDADKFYVEVFCNYKYKDKFPCTAYIFLPKYFHKSKNEYTALAKEFIDKTIKNGELELYSEAFINHQKYKFRTPYYIDEKLLDPWEGKVNKKEEVKPEEKKVDIVKVDEDGQIIEGKKTKNFEVVEETLEERELRLANEQSNNLKELNKQSKIKGKTLTPTKKTFLIIFNIAVAAAALGVAIYFIIKNFIK